MDFGSLLDYFVPLATTLAVSSQPEEPVSEWAKAAVDHTKADCVAKRVLQILEPGSSHNSDREGL